MISCRYLRTCGSGRPLFSKMMGMRFSSGYLLIFCFAILSASFPGVMLTWSVHLHRGLQIAMSRCAVTPCGDTDAMSGRLLSSSSANGVCSSKAGRSRIIDASLCSWSLISLCCASHPPPSPHIRACSPYVYSCCAFSTVISMSTMLLWLECCLECS